MGRQHLPQLPVLRARIKNKSPCAAQRFVQCGAQRIGGKLTVYTTVPLAQAIRTKSLNVSGQNSAGVSPLYKQATHSSSWYRRVSYSQARKPDRWLSVQWSASSPGWMAVLRRFCCWIERAR